jgi:hypothetical protein
MFHTQFTGNLTKGQVFQTCTDTALRAQILRKDSSSNLVVPTQYYQRSACLI